MCALASADENERLPPVRSVCGTPAEVAWLPIAFSADVRMSVGQAACCAARARCALLPRVGYYHCFK